MTINMRKVCASAVLCVLLASSAAAAEPRSSVPSATLSAMGLSSAQRISDLEGAAVRGRGSIAIVRGTGYGLIVRPHFAAGRSSTTSPGGFSAGGGAWAFAR